MGVAEVVEKVAGIVGEKNVTAEDFHLITYAKSMDTTHWWSKPAAVIRPNKAEEVAEVVRYVNELNKKGEDWCIIPRGAATSLTQGCLPERENTIIIDTMSLKTIHSIDPDEGLAIVDVGVTWGQLDAAARPYGRWIGQGAAGAASGTAIGGGLSNNSLGAGGTTKFGCCSDMCHGVEVVLPTGEIIWTGSKVNSFIDKPFGRYGLGPDWTGLFLGDPGAFGIKTKAVIAIPKKPPYHYARSFLLPFEDQWERAIDFMRELKDKLGDSIWEIFHIPDYVTNIFGGLEIYPSAWMCDVGDAVNVILEDETEEGILSKKKLLLEIANKHSAVPYGETIEEGNYAEYHYTHGLGWRVYHPFWGIFGPNSNAFVWVYDTSLENYTKCARAFIDWIENRILEKFASISGGDVAFAFVGFMAPHGIKLVSGVASFDDDETRDLRREIYEEGCELFLKCGGFPGWSDYYSKKAVEVGVYRPEHVEFMKTLKKALDPNNVLYCKFL